APPLDPGIARQAEGNDRKIDDGERKQGHPGRHDQRCTEQGHSGQGEEPPIAADPNACPAIGRQARNHQKGNEQGPHHDRQPFPEQVVAGDEPQIDRYERKARTGRRRNARVEARRLVRLFRSIQAGIETRQPERATDRQCERRDPSETRRRLQRPQEEDQRRGRAERDIVAEGVELGPELALRPQKSRDSSVDSVENAGEDDCRERSLPFAADCKADAGQANAQCQGRDGIGNHRAERDSARFPVVCHWLLPVAGISRPTIPRIVSPAIERWPRMTRGATPSGRYTSTRLPKRMRPILWPASTTSPSRTNDMMRRATSPAIWVKPIFRPSVPSMSRCWRSLSSLALSRSALTNLPGMYAILFTRPAIGVRLICTSNTLMKIETRVYLPSSSPSGPRSSGGGGTSTIIVTNPSAGETINLSPRGVVRTGSRKKAATQIVRPSRSHAITAQCRRKASNVIAPAPTANL